MKILTFDIEEWFLSGCNKKNPPENWDNFENRVVRNTETILSVLDSKGVKATFFILGWIAKKYPQLVKQIHEKGHEIGYHTYYHQNISDFTARTFNEDLKKGLHLLENITLTKVSAFRAPSFSHNVYNEWFYEILIRNGIKSSSSVKSGFIFEKYGLIEKPFQVQVNNQTLVEFPLKRLNWLFIKMVVSGSGYFRLLPFWLTKILYEHTDYSMTYFHPRDIDNKIPYSNKISKFRNLRNQIGSKNGLFKFEALLDTYRFMTLEDARISFQRSISRHQGSQNLI